MLSKRGLKKLNEAICKFCYEKPKEWDSEVYGSWLSYIKGAPHKEINKNTRFVNPASLYYYFRKHRCYKKLSFIQARWGAPVNKIGKFNLLDFSWLLGLYYADGCKKNNNKLIFFLSLHEEKTAKRVFRDLKKIVGSKVSVFIKKERNMIFVYVCSVELCDYFPNKKEESEFIGLWSKFSSKQKLEFIAGFVDGDASTSFDVGINELQIYSKDVCFINQYFYDFLSQFGYVSILGDGYRLYCSKNVVLNFKEFTVKKSIKRPYNGKVDTKRALRLLRQGSSIWQVSQILGFNHKTVHLALKQVYGLKLTKKYTRRLSNPKYS